MFRRGISSLSSVVFYLVNICFHFSMGSLTTQKTVYTDYAVTFDCFSATVPAWLRDNELAQTLAFGDKKMARFTDER